MNECTIDMEMRTNALVEVVNMCNDFDADLNVSIHLNMGGKDYDGNDKTTGVEVYAYSTNSKAYPYAEKSI